MQETRGTFKDWYYDNFMNLSELRELIVNQISQVFPAEHRVQDVWAQVLPITPVNSMLNCTKRLDAMLEKVSKTEVKPFFPIRKAAATRKSQEPIPILHMQGRSVSPGNISGLADSSMIVPFPSRLSQRERSQESSFRVEPKNTEVRSSSIQSSQRRKAPINFTFDNHVHLLKQAKGPKKQIFTNPIEYLNALNKLRFEYSKATQSAFIKNYWRVQPEYKSRRDELGGTITDVQWTTYISKLEKVIKLHKRRRNRRLRRKLRPLGVNVDPLYNSVFIGKIQTPLEISKSTKSRRHSPARRLRVFEV